MTTPTAIPEEEAACRAAFEAHPEAVAAWHRGHAVLCDPAAGWADRIRDILTTKPEDERALRLHLFRPIIGPLPPAYGKARAAFDKAWAAYVKALAAFVKARAAYDKALAAYDKARAASDKARVAYDKASAASDKAWAAYDFDALHAIECGCSWNGRSIFG